jgi:hypothetical protein
VATRRSSGCLNDERFYWAARRTSDANPNGGWPEPRHVSFELLQRIRYN